MAREKEEEENGGDEQVLVFNIGAVEGRWIRVGGGRVEGLLETPSQPVSSYCSPSSEFYHNNMGCQIAGHATGNNKSHLFYSSIQGR